MKRTSLRLCALVFFLLVPFLTPASATAQTQYHVQPGETTIIYSMDHPMHSWSGVSHKVSGVVEVGADLQPVHVELRAPVLSFDSDNKNRDSHMAEVVEYYLYPDVTFTSTHITPGAPDAEGRQTWDVQGNLTFHGVTKPVESVAHVTVNGTTLEAEGEFEVVLTDYDIELPSLLSIKVKDWMRLAFDVRGHAGAAAVGESG